MEYRQIKCSNCGNDWNMYPDSVCQCGAIMKISIIKPNGVIEPSTGMRELMIQFTEEVAYFYEIVGGGKGKDLIFEHVENGHRSTTAELLSCFFEGMGMKPPSPEPPTPELPDAKCCDVPKDLHGTSCGWDNAKYSVNNTGIIITAEHPYFNRSINEWLNRSPVLPEVKEIEQLRTENEDLKQELAEVYKKIDDLHQWHLSHI
jgi:hypothetical protein